MSSKPPRNDFILIWRRLKPLHLSFQVLRCGRGSQQKRRKMNGNCLRKLIKTQPADLLTNPKRLLGCLLSIYSRVDGLLIFFWFPWVFGWFVGFLLFWKLSGVFFYLQTNWEFDIFGRSLKDLKKFNDGRAWRQNINNLQLFYCYLYELK